METITLKKIAKQLGLSISTVSKALKDYPDVSPNTKKKVRNLVAKLNYVPNFSAVSL